MFKLIKRIFTAQIIKKRLFDIIYILGLILLGAFLQHNHQEPEKYVGPTPAEMEVILKQEIYNFNMLPGTQLHFNPSSIKSGVVYIQGEYTAYKKPDEVRAFYIEEAERNGWIFKKEEYGSKLIFNKFDRYQGDYKLSITCFRHVEFGITWEMNGDVQEPKLRKLYKDR
ncbi:MAG: hypothetical protein K0Q87_3901 [Neobacillus sp.]|nr:hypothetical protein [Neobacillus sp.]